MGSVFHNIIDTIISERDSLNRICFANDLHTPPPFSYQVNFPRLELVMSGSYVNELGDAEQGVKKVVLRMGDMIFIPPNYWNKPQWDNECSVLSLLFGKRQLGFSLVSKGEGKDSLFDVQKYSIKAKTGRAIDHILMALNTLAGESQHSPMDEHLIMALLSYCRQMIEVPEESVRRRGEDLYQGICIYIQEHFQHPITRNSIAAYFNISPNHLSRLFREQGHMRLANYIALVRLERAKFLLKTYDLRLNEIAARCGYQDVNYFFRVFKEKTGRTPSEYRNMS